MPWKNDSPRRKQLPPGWSTKTVPHILDRDHSCRWPVPGGVCGSTDRLEVDHKDDPDLHSPDHLWALCHMHHNLKTQAEAKQARRARSRRRPAERHPGALD